MSIIDTLVPTHTLRSHQSKVTTLKLCGLENNESVPMLISGDETGNIIKWDLLTRRPIESFKLPSGAQIIEIHILDGKLVVLSKDNALRMYTGLDITFEMKINTLNFANFEIFRGLEDHLYTLISSNTTNSENIDIYSFRDGELNSLSRTNNAISFLDFIEEHSLLGDGFKKIGIVMKFIRDERRDIIFCGFESGVTIGFKVHRSKYKDFDKDGFLEIIFLSKFHYPNPVLDIDLDIEKGIIITSSTESHIEEIYYGEEIKIEDVGIVNESQYFIGLKQNILMNKNIWSRDSKQNIIETSYKNIGYINILHDIYVFSTWSGKTVVMDRNSNKEISIFWSSRSNVTVSESSQGNIDPNRNKMINKDPKYSKIGAMATFDPKRIDSGNLSVIRNTITTGQFRRFKQFVGQTWCFVGYDNGTIAIYKV